MTDAELKANLYALESRIYQLEQDMNNNETRPNDCPLVEHGITHLMKWIF